MFTVLKVTGNSLSPFYQEGDFVLVSKIPFVLASIKSGDILVFRHPSYGTLIKRAEHLSPSGDEIFAVGTRMDSLDSRQLGPFPRKWVTGKVIWHIRNPRRPA